MKSDQLSQTAAFIAVKFYGLTRNEKYRALFDEDIIHFYELLVESMPSPIKFYRYWLKFKLVRNFYIWSEELLLPGDLMHIIARKWYIKQMVEESIKKGYEQLIVLGAGFDHLAFYYSQQDVPCFEFDTPYMAQRKRNFLSEKYAVYTQPKILSAYLPSDTLQAVLTRNPQIDPNLKTIVIAEGFFDYLKVETVNSALRTIKNHFIKSTLISTHFSLEELSAFHKWVFKSSVQMVGEKLKFKSGISDFRRMLTDHQFNICQQFDSDHIATDFLENIESDLPIIRGFYILKAE